MAAKTTPVMKQHGAAKSAYPDCVIFFRLGDFYEMFGDDAVLVAKELDLTLTSRNKGKADEIPMAGVPHHAAHGYIARLLEKGFKVAVCEQMADPSTVKGIVPREVVRVITPGTWQSQERLEKGEHNWLCAIEASESGVGVAFLDLSTAELMAAEVPDVTAALSELGRLRPREILVNPGVEAESLRETLSELRLGAQVRVDEELSDKDVSSVLAGVSFDAKKSVSGEAAARALLFARRCYRDKEFPVWRVARFNPSGVLGLDRTAQGHLELVESSVGDKRATLFSVLNLTSSPGGARLLRRRLLSPLLDLDEIEARLEQVDCFVAESTLRSEVRAELKSLGDLERLAVRAATREVSPRELGNIRRGLGASTSVSSLLGRVKGKASKKALGISTQRDLVTDLFDTLSEALVERPPQTPKEGAIFIEGFDSELDELAKLRVSGTQRLAELESSLRKQTEIPNLRVKFTRVFGWYAEVGRAHANRVPKSWRRKQTVANGERFTLDELDELAAEIDSADARFRERELALLSELGDEVATAAQRIHSLALWMSSLDVGACLAEVAVEYDYCRPVVDASDRLSVVDGRHPVVERLAAEGRFVPNSLELEARKSHLWLLSGPNMAGKSTFLRQAALSVILAQMGSFVPAAQAHIGLVDRVLSRVGASDNLAGGESTFMVEMRETAEILRTATSRSLVILDEIGRGTSTFDGLSIAWAVAEHLDEVISCRALFATHYHELTALADESMTAENHSVSAREHDGDVIFLHRVTKGAASRSYGVAVAQLAGLPEAVLARSRAILAGLEGESPEELPASLQETGGGKKNQLDLFAKGEEDAGSLEILSTLRQLDVDRLTGIEALQLLVQLQKKLRPIPDEN